MHASAFLRSENYRPRNYRRAASNLSWEVVGRRHRTRALHRFPELAPATLDPCRAELEAAHRIYARDVSTPEYTISLGLAAFLLALCRSRRPERILDLGSGFSSYVFRVHQAQADPRPEVLSADDDDAWRASTRSYLAAHDLPAEGLLRPDEVRWEDARFDLVLHDLNSINSAERAALLAAVAGIATRGGLVVLDDLDGYPYRRRVRAEAARRGLRLLSLRSFLRDGIGRHPGALVPRG
jgi:hypothetical protein